MQPFAIVWRLILGLGFVGCGESRPGAPTLFWETREEVGCERPALDLLLVVDDSASMAEEAPSLTIRIERLLDALVNPGDPNGDGVFDEVVYGRVRVGVASTDLGAEGRWPDECPDADGDVGLLGGGWREWAETKPDPSFSRDVAHIATGGLDGCELERPFEAARRALATEGFLREDALTGVFFLTDEDDCGAGDLGSFDAPPTSSGCAGESLDPVVDFAADLLTLHPGHPEWLIVGAAAGIPEDLVDLSERDLFGEDLVTPADFDAILADPRMQPGVEVACESEVGRASASPRVVDLVREIDRTSNNGALESICDADWPALPRSVNRLIAADGCDSCLHRAISGEDGEPAVGGEWIPCFVIETLPDAATCGPDRIDGADPGTCILCQQGDGTPGHDVGPSQEDLGPCLESELGWQFVTDLARCPFGRVDVRAERGPPGSRLEIVCPRSLPGGHPASS